jgi:hypothetical protein
MITLLAFLALACVSIIQTFAIARLLDIIAEMRGGK